MAGGLFYKIGRDMPPGMQEKFAVQIAQQLTESVTVAERFVRQLTEDSAVETQFTCSGCGAGRGE